MFYDDGKKQNRSILAVNKYTGEPLEIGINTDLAAVFDIQNLGNGSFVMVSDGTFEINSTGLGSSVKLTLR